MALKIGKAIMQELESSKTSKRLGEGWISGVLSLLLAIASLVMVVCMHYPEVLTVPEIRKLVDVTIIRFAVQVMLVIGFILASVSLILRQNKVMGLSAAFIIILSMMLGGSAAQSTQEASGFYFGLDWFLLNLTITGIIFLPFERLFGRVEQSFFRKEWNEDLFYFAFSSLLVQSLTFLTMLPSTVILANSNFSELQTLISSQPIFLQFIEIMLITDFLQYWFHRLFHQVPFLWKFHAVHHSAQSMDWLAGSRMHLIEIILLRSLTIIPTYVMGFDTMAIYAYILVVYLYATYLHANLRFDVEWLKLFIATPRFHHWHHGIEKEAIDVNFAIHFPIYDRLFGTYYMPKNKWPSAYGIKDHPVPSGFIKQFFYPFRK